ncbi:peroxiredoxin family protein [Parapedobacter koreensis]|uniref:Thiol-disulfide isomerase or thioredoxin n=1 Tax=Parapedobacter koreensis TaxID=332977 RepID=A0A1H7GZN2_9SPHI|nr:hypothetical protein [Parapedobacter koreensis]SEK41345.1 hypothetical protein SAMN05421740_101798 [Parapedobacter koreensis]
MKQILRIGEYYALTHRLSAYWRNQQSEIFRKQKRKISSRRQPRRKLRGGRPSPATHKEKLCVQTHAKAPALPGPGLAIGVLALLLLAINISVCAKHEAHKDTITPLQIGDTIPESLWHLPLQVVNHPEGKDTITLSDYRDQKLLILEFWGLSCSGCIQSINKLDTIKDAFDDGQLALLPIHVLPYPFDEAKMLDYVGRAAERNRWSVPSVVKDTTLYGLFSRYLPDWGDVWIMDGRLLAVPTHGYISRETIAAVLGGRFVNFRNRRNAPAIDPYRPLLANGNGEGKVLYRSGHGTVTGYIPHHYPMYLTLEYRADSTYLYTWNRTLPDLLYEAYSPAIMQHLTAQTGIIWATTAMEGRLNYEEDTTVATFERVATREAWNTANLYGYQLRVPGRLTEEEARGMMRRDMEAFAEAHPGIRLSVEAAAPHTYAVLRKLGGGQMTGQVLETTADTTYTDHDAEMYRFIGYPKETLIHNISGALRQNPGINLTITQVVDSTGIPDNSRCRFEFPKSFRDGTADLAAIRNTLERHGLYLTIERANVPVLVVRSTDRRDTIHSIH